ncbi:MAG: hypothetical protein U0133_21475 [Gemmatimonadales bacterium]
MRRGQVLCLGVALGVVAACGGDDSAGPPKGGNVSLDAGAAVHDSVTVAGKVLTATSHGVTYTLTIPAGAVKVPTLITMTPVTGIGSIHVTELVGAVDLQPQGLVLGRPAQLRIASPLAAPPGGNVGVAFNYEGDADTLALLLPADSGGVVTLAVPHFSGAGYAFGTIGMIDQFLPAPGTTTQPNEPFVDSMYELSLRSPRDFLAEQNLMRSWFTTLILPELQGAITETKLLEAISEFDYWRQVVTPGHLIPDDPLFAAERAQFSTAALPRLQEAISADNTTCRNQRDIEFANNVLYWQTVAEDLGLATEANALDRATVLGDLCIHVLITDSTYPNPVQPQQNASLDLLAGLKYGSDPSLDNMRFIWRLDIAGSTADGTVQGPSAADGSFTHVITPSGQGALVVTVSACLFAAEVPYADVCARGDLVRNFECAIVHAGDITIHDSIDVAQARNIREIQGRLVIQNSADLVMNFPCLRNVVQVTALGSGPGILNLSALDAVQGIPAQGLCCGSIDLQGTGLRLVSLPVLTAVGQNLGIRNSPQLTTILLGAPHVVETMAITGNAALTSLTIGAAHIDQTLSLSNNDALTSLGGISSTVVVGQILAIEGNAGFTDADATAFADRIGFHGTRFIDTNGP